MPAELFAAPFSRFAVLTSTTESSHEIGDQRRHGRVAAVELDLIPSAPNLLSSCFVFVLSFVILYVEGVGDLGY